MKTIGLLGGMSWESSIEYERIINQYVRQQRGGSASASLIIRSYDFAEIEVFQSTGDWKGAGELLASDAVRLQDAGAELLVLCTNSMHRLADQIQAAIDVPFVHIADATANAIKAGGHQKVGLLGTRYTMEEDFYGGRLSERHGLSVSTPGVDDRLALHAIIYEELVCGVIDADSRARVVGMIDGLIAGGSECVIAGCTEIELLVGPNDVSVPYYPTTRIHAETAARMALE